MSIDEISTLFAEHGAVEELEFDDAYFQHLAERATYRKHRVRVVEVVQVHAGAPRYFSNRGTGARRAPIIMVGQTRDGRWLCVPIEPTGRGGIWRPVTAFEANAHHRARYRGEQA